MPSKISQSQKDKYFDSTYMNVLIVVKIRNKVEWEWLLPDVEGERMGS